MSRLVLFLLFLSRLFVEPIYIKSVQVLLFKKIVFIKTWSQKTLCCLFTKPIHFLHKHLYYHNLMIMLFGFPLVKVKSSMARSLAVPQDFYSPLSISLERSGLPRIRWCGIGGFQDQVQCLFVGLVALYFFVFNYFHFLFFSSIGW